jgi:sulfide:quinone oxidoreductase
MSSTLILGGGFGGLACARALRAKLPPSHRITLIDRGAEFVVGAAKPWVMLGERAARQVTQRRAALLPEGIDLVQADVLGIDPGTRDVRTSTGAHAADHLVIALGADHDLAAVPGLADAAHTFYSLDGAVRLREALAAFAGGRLVLLIPRLPFSCPPGPYEATLLLHAALTERGLRAKTTLEVWTVEKSPMGTAGPEMGKAIVGLLTERGIGFHPLRKTVSVDGARRAVRFEDGTETAYDLLIAIPPHRAPRVIVEAGLAEAAGWIPIDPATFAVKVPGVAPHTYAIGDVTAVPLPGRWDPAVPLALPKAGIFAAAQGETVAGRIAAAVAGGSPGPAFDGRGHCFIELGSRRAIRAEGDFFATPHPVMSAQAPSEAQYRDKVAWIADLLKEVR